MAILRLVFHIQTILNQLAREGVPDSFVEFRGIGQFEVVGAQNGIRIVDDTRW